MKTMLCGAVALLLMPFGALAGAQDSSDSDDLKALKYYRDVLVSLESLSETSRMTRDTIRPTDWIQKASDKKGSGVLLRGTYKALKELADKADLPKGGWVDRWEKTHKAAGGIRKIAAAIHGLKEFHDAVRNAETSTAEEKLNSMAQIIRDISAIVPSKTPVSTYVGMLTGAIEGVARDAAIIEQHTRKKNELIEAIGKNFGVYDDSKEAEEKKADDLAAAIRELEGRIEARERKSLLETEAEVYGKLRAAEDECARKHRTSMEEISALRMKSSENKGALRRLALKRNAIGEYDRVLQERLQKAEDELALAIAQSKGGADANEVKRALGRIPHLENELKKYRTIRRAHSESGAKRVEVILRKETEVRKRASEIDRKLEAFDECVRHNLADEDAADRALIEDMVPRYARKRMLPVSRPDPGSLNDVSGVWDTTTNARVADARISGAFVFSPKEGKPDFQPQPNTRLHRMGYVFTVTSIEGAVIKGKWNNPGYRGEYEIKFGGDAYNSGYVRFTGKYSRAPKTGTDVKEEWYEWNGWYRARKYPPPPDDER